MRADTKFDVFTPRAATVHQFAYMDGMLCSEAYERKEMTFFGCLPRLCWCVIPTNARNCYSGMVVKLGRCLVSVSLPEVSGLCLSSTEVPVCKSAIRHREGVLSL